MKALKNEIRQLVSQSFYDDSMRELATSFVDFKEKEAFRFGGLVLFHYNLHGGEDPEIKKIAAAMELLILAIDIFDDLVDQDNSTPPWTKIPPGTATHIAMGLLMASQKAIEEANFDDTAKQEARKIVYNHTLRCIYGQEKDSKKEIINEGDYLRITKEKSGSLISCACLLGAIFAGCYEHFQAVKEYGEHFGIAVQISNDINDILSETSKNDFLHKKKTLPVLYLLKSRDPIFSELKDYFKGELSFEQIQAKQKQIIENIKTSGAIEYAQVMMQIEIKKSKKIINAMNLPVEAKGRISEILFGSDN